MIEPRLYTTWPGGSSSSAAVDPYRTPRGKRFYSAPTAPRPRVLTKTILNFLALTLTACASPLEQVIAGVNRGDLGPYREYRLSLKPDELVVAYEHICDMAARQASRGDSGAMGILGKCYELPLGRKIRDPDLARLWYGRAAAKGDAAALEALVRLGEPVPGR